MGHFLGNFSLDALFHVPVFEQLHVFLQLINLPLVSGNDAA
jgi:hypothetical protein